MAIVAPGCLHADRRHPETKLRTKTCYRTYRGRGWCVLEVFGAYLSRDKQYPCLLITSKEGTPEWVSSLDTLNLAVGTSDFTCCQRNHIFGDRVVPCDRGITRKILEEMIEAKVQHFFKLEHTLRARLCRCLANWWLRTKSMPEENCSGSIASFKTFLRWNEKHEEEWVDQDEVPILLYAVIWNDIDVVREILNSEFCTRSRLNETLFENGVVEFGLPARSTILNGSMSFSSVQIVTMLLEKGADPYATEKNGMDSLMLACMLGRTQNVKFWISKFQDWDINRGNIVNGSTALHCAVFFGRNKLDVVRALLERERGASVNVLNHGGASVLSNAVDSVDSNVNVVDYLLNQTNQQYGVNHRRRALRKKWKLIYGLARGLYRFGVVTSGLFAELASESGSTPLQYAASRGEVEMVELLMEHGAEPSIKNDLGRDILSYCQSFPEIKGAIRRIERENNRLLGTMSSTETARSTTTTKMFTLQRRLSTATPVKYDMYVLNVSTMFTLFGDQEERRKNMNLCHQDLLRKGKLTRFEDLPLGAFVMFVSHQWNGFNHPDPKGVQIECMVKTFRGLRDGKIHRVETDPFHTVWFSFFLSLSLSLSLGVEARRIYSLETHTHTHTQIIYKQNFTTKKKEWKHLLSSAYVFYDFWSQPQPTMEPEKNLRQKELKIELELAISSMGAYVERSDCLVVLVPSTTHIDRIDSVSGRYEFTCYRTYRRRAFCVMEMMCTYLSRRKTHPMLLIRSSQGQPQWVSSLESHKLAVGDSNFTCCERNHEGKFKKCDRYVARDVLKIMIEKKTKHLFELRNIIYARLTQVQTHWFLRGLPKENDSQMCKSVEEFRVLLQWDENLDGVWFDRGKFSILLFAVASNNVCVVRELLEKTLDETLAIQKEDRQRLLHSVTPKEGYVAFGLTANMNALCLVRLFLTLCVDASQTNHNNINIRLCSCHAQTLLECFLIEGSIRCWQTLMEIILFSLRVFQIA